VDLQEVIYWLRRLSRLDFRVFDDIRNNPSATVPCVVVCLFSMLIAGLGGWLWWLVSSYPRSSEILVNSFVLGGLLAFFLWGVIWLGIVYITLTQVMRQRAYFEQLMRVMGLAATPMALMLLMFLPGVSFAIGLAALALTFGLSAIAIKSVTTADYAQVLAANFLGFLVWAAALTLLGSSNASFQPHAPGIFLYHSVNSAVSEGLEASE
jgi:hypothetical protein